MQHIPVTPAKPQQGSSYNCLQNAAKCVTIQESARNAKQQNALTEKVSAAQPAKREPSPAERGFAAPAPKFAPERFLPTAFRPSSGKRPPAPLQAQERCRPALWLSAAKSGWYRGVCKKVIARLRPSKLGRGLFCFFKNKDKAPAFPANFWKEQELCRM